MDELAELEKLSTLGTLTDRLDSLSDWLESESLLLADDALETLDEESELDASEESDFE